LFNGLGSNVLTRRRLLFHSVWVGLRSLASRGTVLTLALAAVLLTLFVVDCLRSKNPFVDPGLICLVPLVLLKKTQHRQ
jgi:hypothetical protein